MRVEDLGEQGLLKRLHQFCPSDIVGDDAALLPVAPGHALVVTTDLLVDGVHFSDQTTSPTDAGWRAAAANLSDLAAMGAMPLGLTIGLSLPGDVQVSWVESLYQGIVECLQPYNAAVVGGDVCRSSVITIAITALGQVLPEFAIRRSGALPGDAIVVTGAHGASRAGLELLLHPELGRGLLPSERESLIQAHQRPQPRLDVIAQLHLLLDAEQGSSPGAALQSTELQSTELQSTESAALLRAAGMDSSDGLADAVLQVCRASRVGARLERNLIPFPPCLTAWVTEAQAINWALYGGEDFELVLCLPRTRAQQLVRQLGGSATIIGRITAEPDVILQDQSGTYQDEILSLDKGFQHFQA